MAEIIYCQSCGRKMDAEEDFSRERDGTRNLEYCSKCYLDGSFAEPDLTRWQIIARILPVWMKEKNVPYREALIDANYFISTLRRWQTKKMWT